MRVWVIVGTEIRRAEAQIVVGKAIVDPGTPYEKIVFSRWYRSKIDAQGALSGRRRVRKKGTA